MSFCHTKSLSHNDHHLLAHKVVFSSQTDVHHLTLLYLEATVALDISTNAITTYQS
jgi:hypothetical protein